MISPLFNPSLLAPELWSEDVLALLLTPPHQDLNVCTIYCSQVFLGLKSHFQHQLLSSSSCIRVPAGPTSSRPAPASTVIPICLTSYALKMETPSKMFHGVEADFSHFRVIEVRTFVHIKDS